ncbi:protein O-linked-mannose beta-1,4-N-acetylglucosaminyltransferase 2-like protein [Carex littledalei]|uniref:Protein O-linked-mannose beta-1,4-N-acetylglucosaminyltransferase 2-like protein n=1 Tax=Carex littledalei TaxID=544730 RepID=A0A833VBP0_9POAL|nr:protein O-linked-mannose beta-1,4-N-acetylglucosaminyltransferase 2-like protein [Carex littledalei]
MTVQQLTDANQARSCDVTHNVPPVVFSTAMFLGNLFHDYTDMIYPLFLATHRYNGEVKLVVENHISKTIEKYRPYLTRLSHYPIINLDTKTRVHCFSSAQVGLQNIRPLGRSEVQRGKKPRLLVLPRNTSRSIINEDDVINLAKDVGYEVITGDAETTKDFPAIAHIVNSCDVLIGIRGAGLANMLYLSTNGTVLQITPFGYLKWVGKYDYDEPPSGFGLRYVEYEITLEESTLIENYPRDHSVLTDPQSIHKRSWQEVYDIYLWEQSVKLDLDRFRGSLEVTFIGRYDNRI